ncbi:MAG: hypothetical protein U9N33_09835 [Campylobacterota bacterium]|nr:hypothetical protein [Campylobacterota bacterium]
MINNETIKEVGKLFVDLAKIIFAITIITPLAKNEAFDFTPFIFGVLAVIFGIYLINKGLENE